MIIDVKKLLCPMPVIRLSEAIKLVKIGDTITIIATDIGVLHDIPAWTQVHRQKIVTIQQDEDIITIVVKKII